jgi:hypothetical protein
MTGWVDFRALKRSIALSRCGNTREGDAGDFTEITGVALDLRPPGHLARHTASRRGRGKAE